MSFNPQTRVLCVDDDDDSREMLPTLLKLLRIEARTVRTGAEALSLVHSERFDLYLLDVELPDLDGFELCCRMRVFDPYTPIVFFSGAAEETHRERAIAAGADAYVIKPDVEELLESIAQFVFHAKSVAA